VLTAAGFAGLLSQLPGGALLDAIRSKRFAVALGAVMVAAGAADHCILADFPLVLTALVLQGITGAFWGWRLLPSALAWSATPRSPNDSDAISASPRREGGCGRSHGPHRLFPVVSRDIFRRCRAGVAAARPLGRIRSSDIHFGRASCLPNHQGPSAPPRARLRSLSKNRGLIIFAGCVFLFQMANASMLPLAGEALAYSMETLSSLIVSALIMSLR